MKGCYFMKKPLQTLFALTILMIGSITLLAPQPATPSAHAASLATGTSKSYRLVIQNSDSTLKTYIANAQQEFALVYPQLVTRWSANPNTAPTTVTLRFVKNLGNPAETLMGKNLIEVDLDYARKNPYDPGVLTHELTHVMQNYPESWLTEAIANYSSQLYGPRREDIYRSAAKYIPGATYTSDPYDTGARFLFWIAQNKRHDIVDQLHRLLQAGKYTSNSFVQLTGKTLKQLWAAYQASGSTIFTLYNKTPEQIYQSVTALTPDLTTTITTKDAANWQVIQGKSYHCGFQGKSYTVSATVTNTFLPCAGLNTAGHNFAYQVNMTITQGNSGGIIGRGVDAGNGLRFRVGSDGTFDLVNGQTTLIPSTSSPAIKQGKQTNTLLMAVEDQKIYLYVNGQYLGHASDTWTGGGYFGFMAVDFGKPTSVNYTNVKIWQW